MVELSRSAALSVMPASFASRGALGLWLGAVARVLLPYLSPVVMGGIDEVDGMVHRTEAAMQTADGDLIAAHHEARGLCCGRCGRVSKRLHIRYRRQLVDLPVAGRPVAMWLTVRRSFCERLMCGCDRSLIHADGA